MKEIITIENSYIVSHGFAPSIGTNQIEVSNWQGNTGEPITFYDEKNNYKRKTNKELIEKNLLILESGTKLDEETDMIIPMTQVELIQAGLEEVPTGYKIFDDDLVKMTNEEKLEANVITQAEYNGYQIDAYKSELTDIDTFSLRPLRAILAGTGTDEDKTKLAELEEKANEIRAKLKELL
jgi:hypothetical protein